MNIHGPRCGYCDDHGLMFVPYRERWEFRGEVHESPEYFKAAPCPYCRRGQKRGHITATDQVRIDLHPNGKDFRMSPARRPEELISNTERRRREREQAREARQAREAERERQEKRRAAATGDWKALRDVLPPKEYQRTPKQTKPNTGAPVASDDKPDHGFI